VTHPSGHEVRLAFPPGPRRAGSGKVVSILHPKGENACRFDAKRLRESGVASRESGNPKKKELTREQVEKKQAKAVAFLRNVVKDSDKADEIEGLSVSEYAERKKIGLSNPRGKSKGKEQKAKGKDKPLILEPGVHETLTGEKIYLPFRIVANRKKNAALTKADVAEGRIYYVKQIDRDAGLVRFHGPFTVPDAQERVTNFKRIGHGAQLIRTPDPAIAAVRRRKNQASEQGLAAELYKTFHGKKPKEILEFQADTIRRQDYAALGKLIEIVVHDAGKLIFIDFAADNVILASNAEGTQLYLVGGNQDVRGLFDKTQLDATKDLVVLGLIKKITYRARKDFDRFEEIDYVHTMGEGGHEKPTLIFDQLNQTLAIAGGEYEVKREGIVH
jgi:hypothetical protein